MVQLRNETLFLRQTFTCPEGIFDEGNTARLLKCTSRKNL